MKIAFWSNSRGMGGVTSNLACISVMQSLMAGKRAVLFENHFDINNLGYIFHKTAADNKFFRETSQYAGSKRGTVYSMLEQIDRECINYSDLSLQQTISYVNQNLYYIPGTKSYDEEKREFFLQKNMKTMLSIMNDYMDMVYIDTASSHHESSRIILQEVDRVVVNLPQNPNLLTYFFRNFSEVRKKAFYIIGNYNYNSEFDKEFIERTYGISRENLGVIPHHVPFADAMAKGKLLSFIQENLECKKDSPHYLFMKEVKESVVKLKAATKSSRYDV